VLWRYAAQMLSRNDITIARFQDIDSPAARSGVEAVFWETAAAPHPTGPERVTFRDLWLDQYLRHEPQLAFVARDHQGRVGGYLVGCHSDPAQSPRFATLPYFQTFAAGTARYPAHLHINLTADWRGAGIGGLLIDAFAETVRAAGLGGFHVVTGAGARNVAFYIRQGFREIARSTNERGNAVVFLGHDA
jgi:ribosomal protein S18 acetylase RimI-like enzyme